MKVRQQDAYIFLLFSGVWTICYMLNNFGTYHVIFYKTLFWLLFTINLSLILHSVKEKRPIELVFFGYITLYMLPYIYVINRDVYLAIYQKEKDWQLFTKTLLIYTLFILPFLLFRSKKSLKIISIKTSKNEIAFSVLLVVFFLLWHFGIRGQNILISGGYGRGIEKKSPIYEYLLIVVFLLYKYSGESKKKMYVFYCCCILYAGKNLLFGGRIETLMLLIMIYFLIFQRKIPFGVLIIFASFFYYIMQVFSNIRGNIKAVITGNWYAVFNIFHSSSTLDYLGTNEGDVFWAAERMLYLIRDGYLSLMGRISAGISFFLSVFIPRSFLGGYDNLAAFRMDVYGTGGGGLAPLFFYAMFSIVGVFIIGYIIASFLNGITKRPSFKNIYILFMIVSLPRWFAYYPIQLIKLDIIAVFVTWMFSLISDFVCKYGKCHAALEKTGKNEIID